MKEGLKVTIDDLLTWLDKMSADKISWWQNVCGQYIVGTKCHELGLGLHFVLVTCCPCDILSLWHLVLAPLLTFALWVNTTFIKSRNLMAISLERLHGNECYSQSGFDLVGLFGVGLEHCWPGSIFDWISDSWNDLVFCWWIWSTLDWYL